MTKEEQLILDRDFNWAERKRVTEMLFRLENKFSEIKRQVKHISNISTNQDELCKEIIKLQEMLKD